MIRVRLAFLAVVLGGCLIVWKIGHIQFVEGDRWKQRAEDIGMQYRTVKATRGNIYAGDKSLLATSLPFYKIALDPTIAKSDVYKAGIDSLAMLLSRHFNDRPATYYKRKINDARIAKKRYVVLNNERIDYQEKKKMQDWPIFREGRMGGGVIFEKVDVRYKPFKALASRTVGYLNADNYGAGLEYSFNDILSGKNGEALFQKIAGGAWKPVQDASDIRPEDGFDIETTIDINIQDVAESALLKTLQRTNAAYGTVVVMEVATGHIKAMSNLSRRGDTNDYYENYNYAVGQQGLTEPGSTFKLLSMIALLEETSISLSDTIDTGDGNYRFYDRIMRDSKEGGYGKITVKEAFELSSNVAISRLVDENFGAKPQKYVDYIHKMKMGEPLNFQLTGEGKPYVKTPGAKNWYGTTLPWMSIGYEVQMTPLQTLTLYNAIANEGKMVKPIIVKQISKAQKVIETFDTEVLNPKIASTETLDKVKTLLEGVVENGTAKNVRNANYKIAGKTGTARKLENGRYVQKYYTSFAGYFPAENPKYSAIVVIDSPKGWAVYGSDVSAPVFKEIADKIYSQDLNLNEIYFTKNDYKPDPTEFPVIQAGHFEDLNMICNLLGISNHYNGAEPWVKSRVVNNAIEWKANQVESPIMPDVLGMTLRDALYVLENKGITVHHQGKGRVKSQSLAYGAKIQKGTNVYLTLN